MKAKTWLFASLIIALLFSGCTDRGKESLSIAGSTTVQPISIRAAETYMEKNDVDIAIQGGGSGTGIKMVGEGMIDIGASSRELREAEKEAYPDLIAHSIAADGIAIIVNPKNDIEDLTLEQVKDIFSGKIRNFNEVGGPDKEIVAVIREEGSGTRATFEELAMGGAENSDESQQKPSNGALKATVSGNENAIGYLGLGYIDETVKKIRVDGIEASEETIAGGSYPLSRNLYMITAGAPGAAAKDFIDYILSAEGQDIVEEEGFIRVA